MTRSAFIETELKDHLKSIEIFCFLDNKTNWINYNLDFKTNIQSTKNREEEQ